MMTNEEIKKGLVLCQDGRISVCRDCPYTENCDGTQLYKDALNLITEQEKDIKQLKTECILLDDELRIARQETIDVLNKLKAENEELSKVVSSKVYDLIDNTKEIADAREAWEQQAKIDVLNELWEKVKDEGVDYKIGMRALSEEIDELIKEQLKK